MCRFNLDPCPFPHQHLIASLIFLPANLPLWTECDQPRPWGRLSCGNLIIQHTTRPSHREAAITADCKWCTAVLKMTATKSKEIQKKARDEIEIMEEKINKDPEMKQLCKDIAALEQDVANLRLELWGTRKAKGIDGSSGEWEEVKAEI